MKLKIIACYDILTIKTFENQINQAIRDENYILYNDPIVCYQDSKVIILQQLYKETDNE